ncbi:hypothetical protein FRC02_010778 [Tulasnella sp. 418]|nr:hypothetical protein FRC02_010778 [Tulasnella sp. 418]
MGRYQSEVVNSMLKNMGRIERAYFAQAVNLARLCRTLQAEAGKYEDLDGKIIDQLEDAFKAANAAIAYVNTKSHDQEIARKKFIDAEGKLSNIPLSFEGLDWKTRVASEMRKANMKDGDGLKRLAEVPELPPRVEVEIEIKICDERMGQACDTRVLRGCPDDNLDGLLFLLAPPGRPREGGTRLAYHPHFYIKSSNPDSDGTYGLLDHWTTIKSLPESIALYLAHNVKGSPFLLLAREILVNGGLPKTEVILTALDSTLQSLFLPSAKCQFVNRKTKQLMDAQEDRWDKFPPDQVREFYELDWKLVIEPQVEQVGVPPAQEPLSPTSFSEASSSSGSSRGTSRASTIDTVLTVPDSALNDADTAPQMQHDKGAPPPESNVLYMSAIVLVVLIMIAKLFS